ncbi:MAG: NAD(+) diphosphatase [Desulfobacteraceae bacterium]
MTSFRKTFHCSAGNSYLFALTKPFLPECGPDNGQGEAVYWFIFQKDHLVLAKDGEDLRVPYAQQPPLSSDHITYQRCIGRYAGAPCMVAELLPELSIGCGFTSVGLREAYGNLSLDLWTIAGRAAQILTWQRDHRFCGRCGTVMQELQDEVVKKCSQCGFTAYPRLSPAVIVAVIKDNAILLGRAARFPKEMYSVLAGFVEPGETLEEAVIREVKEEADIKVKDVRYMASQSWPFPHSLMVGFTARYDSGTVRVNDGELADVRWFTPDNMPPIPSTMSIARRLIDLFLKDCLNV